MASAVLWKFLIWALVVAIPVFIVSVVAVTLCHVIHRSLISVTLAVNGVKRAVELAVVAEVAGFALCANCCEESSNVGACYLRMR